MSDEPAKASEFQLKAVRDLDRRRTDILAGDATPTQSDRMAGLPPLSDNPIADLRRIVTIEIDSGRHKGRVLAAMRRLVDAPSAIAAVRLATMLRDDHDELSYSLTWLAALLGHRRAVETIVTSTVRYGNLRRVHIPNVRHAAFALGLASAWPHREATDQPYEPGHLGKLVERGLYVLRDLARAIAIYDDAEAQIEAAIAKGAKPAEPDTKAAEAAAVDALLAAVEEDRAETVGIDLGTGTKFSRVAAEVAAAKQAQFSHLVVPDFPEVKPGRGSDRLKIREEFRGVAGKRLRLVRRGDVAAHRRTLVDRWPHLADEIDVILGDLAVSEAVRFRPTLLVGNPGAGKTALARAIAATMELPVAVYNGGGFADGSFAGLASVWSSSGPSMPLHLIGHSRIANPLVIIDEIDKAARSHNGSLQDAVLQFLEPSSAVAFRDPSIELTVDVSRVNYVLTANTLETISRPLRDRCRIIRIPDPGPEHLARLVPHIVADIARDRGVDARWYPPLAGDELDVVRHTWVSGSIRKLRRVVELMLDGRDLHPAGRA